MQKLKSQRLRKCKFGICILIIIFLLCEELPIDVWASSVLEEKDEVGVSENEIVPMIDSNEISDTSSDLGTEMETEMRTVNFAEKISELRSKFPHGKYWNHYVSRAGEDGNSLYSRGDTSFADSVTDHPCATHSGSASVGQYDCNFYGGIQCNGFARRVYKYVYGVDFSSNEIPTKNWQEVEVGDLIVIENGNHWAFVIERNGNKVKIVEANRAGNCRINWDREIDLTNCGFVDARHKPNDVNLVLGSSDLKISLNSQYTTTQDITVNWNSFNGATRYGLSIWKYPYGNDSYLVYDSSQVTGTSKNVGKLPAGKYRCQMAAYSGNTFLKVSNQFDFTVVAADTTPPNITYLRSFNATNTQFSVRAVATDNVKVAKIEFNCYAPGSSKGIKKTVAATAGDATATFKLSELKAGEGTYRIEAYAYDSMGNKSSTVRILYVYINCTAPTITNIKIVKTSPDSYTLQADIADPNAIGKVEWITWKPEEKSSSSKGYVLTDTIAYQTNITLTKTIDLTKISGNNPIAYGNYTTKIVAYDAYGNKREYTITVPLQKAVNNNQDNESGNTNAGTEGFVYRLYNVAMGREADTAGLNDWNHKLKSKEQTAAQVAQGFIFSQEFQNHNYNNVQFVKILYRTMFGREADEGGLNGWVSDLENGMSREYVYRGFAESQEFTNLCNTYGVERGKVTLSAYRDRNAGATGFIARLYTKMLGREYDADGLEYWCKKYHTKANTIEEIATVGFLHSQELQNLNLSNEEFVRRMYQTFLNREPEEAGLKDWVGRLERGEVTRDSLVYGFTNSAEFGKLKAEYNLP